MPKTATEEIVIPKDLQTFLEDVAEGRCGFKLGEPWKYSEETLAVVVPIVRMNAPERLYTTMYEVLKDLGIKDTGSVDRVQLQNKSGKAVFVRAGSIFGGGQTTQSRAAENSTVLQPGKDGAPKSVEVPVRCVHQSQGIRQGSEMKYAGLAPMSVTMNLVGQCGQSAVWDSVRRYTSGDKDYHTNGRGGRGGFMPRTGRSEVYGARFESSTHYAFEQPSERDVGHYLSSPRLNRLRKSEGVIGGGSHTSCNVGQSGGTGGGGHNFVGYVSTDGPGLGGTGSDNLVGYMNKVEEGRKELDEMMQKVPLFKDQVGAIIFNPVGVVAVETFDHPMSWEAVKKEVIEKHGDKLMEKQAEHLFELKPDKIAPAFRKFIKGLKESQEHSVRKDDLSETRIIVGKGLVGEYTLVKGRVVHSIIVREAS